VPYSLVSAATLGFDLVRLPAGHAVAGVLLTGLGADAGALGHLAAADPGRGLTREERGVLAVRGRRAREMAASVPHLRSAASAGDRAAVLVAQLEQGTIGDAPTLERLLRDDVLGPEHRPAGELPADERDEAVGVLADAAVGYWAAGVLPPLVRRPERRPWATAMHEASWAAHVSRRTRALATAQLHAVRAFLDGGFDLHDGAAGVWNALAGCVQGLAMGDLLDEGSQAVLQAPARRIRSA
jgi:hypothetical protein